MTSVLSSELVEEEEAFLPTAPHDEAMDTLSTIIVDNSVHPIYNSEVLSKQDTLSIPPSASVSNLVVCDWINHAACSVPRSLLLSSDSSSKITQLNKYDDVFYDANDLDVTSPFDSVPVSHVPVTPLPMYGSLPVTLSWFRHVVMPYFLFCLSFVQLWVGRHVNRMIGGVSWVIALGMTNISQWLFFGEVLFWDTIELFVHPSVETSIPRCHRRAKVLPAKYFPRHWMLLSSLMLLSGYKMHRPLDTVLIPVFLIYQRCQRIGNLTHMSPLIVRDLHRLRFNSLFFRDVFEDTLEGILPVTDTVSHHNQPSDDECYFDAHEELHSLDLFQLDCLSVMPTVVDCTHCFCWHW
jgi:hypothetical protein